MRALASPQCGPGSIPRLSVIQCMWIEFAVGSSPCSERFSSLLKNQHFQIPMWSRYYCQPIYHERLAQEIVQALPVLLKLNKLPLQKVKNLVPPWDSAVFC